MARIGYTMMTEHAGPRELVEHVAHAEEAGFDFSVTSDHFSPWLAAQGHAPYAWTVLGAAAQATQRIPLMTYVTCPTLRYHPVVVAQKAATLQLLSGGRFRLGLGAGENLNEHVIGRGWPPPRIRHEMLDEAVEIIRALFDGGEVTFRGRHFDASGAKLWDLPDEPPPIGIAMSGPRSASLAGRQADLGIAVEPEKALVDAFREAGGAGRPMVGQLPVSWDPDRDAAVARAHDQFRWFGGGWRVNANLPGTQAFDDATQFVRKEDVAAGIPCGDDVDAFASAVAEFLAAGFTEVALVQIGGDTQHGFLDWARRRLLPELARL
ncbi:TIGR03557 family F420-dependent LLM class oxidoreductase [Uniformispora flossi]|uniref:TIGR03557 family F420-dependent LLM class oxidoreductase n=1 Tax=Uniformispora flossi TaxID=3390723 RepID=UPI003C2CF34F